MSIKINEYHKERLVNLKNMCSSFVWYDVTLQTDWTYSDDSYEEVHNDLFDGQYNLTRILQQTLVAILHSELKLLTDYDFWVEDEDTLNLVKCLKKHLETLEDWDMSDPLDALQQCAIKEFNEGRTTEGLIDG